MTKYKIVNYMNTVIPARGVSSYIYYQSEYKLIEAMLIDVTDVDVSRLNLLNRIQGKLFFYHYLVSLYTRTIL